MRKHQEKIIKELKSILLNNQDSDKIIPLIKNLETVQESEIKEIFSELISKENLRTKKKNVGNIPNPNN